MAVEWPTTLPENPADYNEQKQSVTVNTQPDSGPTKSRRRFTKAVTKGSMSFLLTNDQAIILDDFWTNDMSSGAVKVNLRHPWRDVVIEMRIPQAPKYASDGPLSVRASFDVEYL